MRFDPDKAALRDHQAWLGYLQPDGLVVSPAALADSQVVLDRQELVLLQERFQPWVHELSTNEGTAKAIADLSAFVQGFLAWPADCLFGLVDERPLPDELVVPLSELGETLEPSFAFKDPKPAEGVEKAWLLLVKELSPGVDLDAASAENDSDWHTSPTRKFERLLRETGVRIGILSNGVTLRIVYAPRGENAGTLTFPVSAMTEVTGRSILGALDLLLGRYRLLAAPSEARLPALLKKSRDYQANVSTALAGQVLDSLYELLRGFQAANDRTDGALLREVLDKEPNEVYAGLLNALLRLVFLLFAEDRGLMPSGSLYAQNYSIHGLFERLREDQQRYPDTMDHRYGAWAQLLAVFRAVHRGCQHGHMKMPARQGYLFDPKRFPFLEGRLVEDKRVLPLVSDGVIFRVLQNLLILGGERLSYRTLDVEQIGSVYEVMMGFRLEVADGPCIAIKAAKKQGAPASINLEALLATTAASRSKWLQERTDQKLSGNVLTAVKKAETQEELLAALEKKIAHNATPYVVPAGAMILQPSQERRKTGSHYTPRSFTEPIVRRTLAPIIEELGDRPKPEQILELKVCDPAVGSGAFLVEACRQLGDALVEAWHTHKTLPIIPPDEDELLHARRLVAQRCLYGVDRNPMAADLAKLSLWLATLAKDHPFTFLDHAIRSGDSLVGLTKQQIEGFTWEHKKVTQRVFGQDRVEKRLKKASEERVKILDGGDTMLPDMKRQLLSAADSALDMVRFVGDLCVAAFFDGKKAKERNNLREDYLKAYSDYLRDSDLTKRPTSKVECLRGEGTWKHDSSIPVHPFHWEIEFPEVFQGKAKGFDAIIGNPPFAGKNTTINGNREGYVDWLKALHEESHGNADLVAHFFRRAFNLLRSGGCLGLIATNTIAQGDTRSTGLRWICSNGGTIYEARKRVRWPSAVSVIVSVLHIRKNDSTAAFLLDGKHVPTITAYLFHAGGHEDPDRLQANVGKSFQGSIVLGMGFTFDDTDKKGVANSLEDMKRLVEKDPRNNDRIFPYIGGEEVNDSPTHAHHRYVINFGDMNEEDARLWPDLISIIERRVKPFRLSDKRASYRKFWWQFAEKRVELSRSLASLEKAICISRVRATGFTFVPSRMVFSEQLVVFPLDQYWQFGVLQSRIHETWSHFFSGTALDLVRYAPSDCFATFPFPEWNDRLEENGKGYFESRKRMMVANSQGLTKTYNRFHDPNESSEDIIKLRTLHAEMDHAVLNAYGWTDIPTDCDFLLDYEEEEETSSRKKKPWRYRWPDEVRDEILARLLALNAERAQQEQLSGAAAKKAVTKKKRTRKQAKKAVQTKVPQPAVVPLADIVAQFSYELPDSLRFAAGTALEYHRLLITTLVQQAGGRLPWRDLVGAVAALSKPAKLSSEFSGDRAKLVQRWAASYTDRVDPATFNSALDSLIVSSQALRIATAEDTHELIAVPSTPAIALPWILLDARIALTVAARETVTDRQAPWNLEPSTTLKNAMA